MPISSIGSFLPVMQQFINHWTAVNAAIAPTPLLLQGGHTLANFTADRAALQAAITAIESADNERQGSAADRDIKKSAAMIRLAQYRALVIGMLAGTAYVKSLPKSPRFTDNQSKILKALDDMSNGWTRINADVIPGFTPPLILAGGYALAGYNTDLAAMRAAFVASTNADDNSRQSRGNRDVLLPPAKARMVQYRQAVKGILPAGSPLLLTIPAVSPAPGSTPDAVDLAAVWQ